MKPNGIMSTQPCSVKSHPVNHPLLTQVADDLLHGLIGLRRERTVPAWKLSAAGIAPLGDLVLEMRRRELARREVAA